MMVWPLSALTQAAAALELTRVTSLVTPPPSHTCHVSRATVLTVPRNYVGHVSRASRHCLLLSLQIFHNSSS